MCLVSCRGALFPVFVMASLLMGCPARPPVPPKTADAEPQAGVVDGDATDGLRFAEELVDGLLAHSEEIPPDPDAATPAEGEPESSAKTAAASDKTKETPAKEPQTPSTATAACDELCQRGTACVAKLIDAQEKRLRNPSQAKKRLRENELMCRDDCDDRMTRATDKSAIITQAVKCTKASTCEAFMRCVEDYFEDD